MSGPAPSSHTAISIPAALTIENSAEFFEALSQIDTSACSHVVLDAAQLETLTTPGLQLLLSYSCTLEKNGGSLKLQNLRADALDILRLYGIEDQASAWSTS